MGDSNVQVVRDLMVNQGVKVKRKRKGMLLHMRMGSDYFRPNIVGSMIAACR
jgi:hypothetical protein